LYVTLGLDIDAPHPASVAPTGKPSALRGKLLAAQLPANYRTVTYYSSHSPAQAFLDLRGEPALKAASDAQLWDLVALIWRSNRAEAEQAQTRQLYAQNCAACHGEKLDGNGVFAERLAEMGQPNEMGVQKPANFSDPASMFGASPALLEGKIKRGGMGTGMPMWGVIFTDQQIKSLIDYLYTGIFNE
jgi:mono/diheme cytochrome c family protein